MARGSTESPIRGVRHASCSVVRATFVSLGCGMAVRALKNSSHVVLGWPGSRLSESGRG